MSALTRPNGLDVYRDRLADFHEIEDFMGEMAELLAHVADALSHDPGEIDVSKSNLNGLSVDEIDWPSFARVQSTLKTWRTRRDALMAAWTSLSEAERAEAGSLPPFGAPDPSRPIL